MKIVMTDGALIATAESIADIKLLISLTPRATTKHVAHNAWKGKHRQVCPTCGKKYKNIKLHMLKKHQEPNDSANAY